MFVFVRFCSLTFYPFPFAFYLLPFTFQSHWITPSCQCHDGFTNLLTIQGGPHPPLAIVCTRCYLTKKNCHCTDGFANGGAVGALLCRRCVNTRPACECNDGAVGGGKRDKFVLGGGFAAGLCLGCDQTMVCCTCYRGFAGQLNTSLIEWHKKELVVEEEPEVIIIKKGTTEMGTP